MYAASPKLLAAIRDGSHTRTLKLEWLQSLSDFTVRATYTPHVLGGHVQAKAQTEGRRTLVAQLDNPAGVYTPLSSADPFWANNVLRASYGVVYPGGAIEYVPIGTFLVNRAWAHRALNDAVVTVDAMDFWKQLKQAALTSVVTYTAGTSLDTVFRDLVARAGLSQLTIDPVAQTTYLRTGVADLKFGRGTSIADCFTVLADDYGWNFWFDVLGVFSAEPSHQLWNQAAVYAISDQHLSTWDVEGGVEDSFDVKNHVGVSGSTPDGVPVFAEVRDLADGSPTRADGPFGDRYFEYAGDWVQTVAQAQQAAKTILRRKLYLARKAHVKGAPLVWLDAFDVVTLTSSDLRVTNGLYYVDGLTLDLSLGESSVELLNVYSFGPDDVGVTTSITTPGYSVFITPWAGSKANVAWGTRAQNSGRLGGGCLATDTGLVNNQVTYEVWLDAGTYKWAQVHTVGNNIGIYTLALNGVSKGTIDGYAVGTTENTYSEVAGIVVAMAGLYALTLTMATKNASSAAYNGLIESVALLRTGN